MHYSEADLAFINANYENFDGGGYEIGDPNAQGLFVNQQLFVSAPEPMTIALFGAGLIGFGALRRRRKPTA